jgi:aspartate aminotransferase-like enzyme
MLSLSERAVDRINNNHPACYYLDLKSALKNAERGQTPFTPAVGILIQINARLNEIANKGLQAEQEKVATIANDFRTRIKDYPFHIVSESLSNAVTPLSPNNEAVSAYQIFQILKDEYDIIVCPNGGAMADKIFRVGHMGNLTIADNDALFAAFDDLMARGILLK